MRVVKNYLYNVGYQVLVIIVPLITSYYVSRVLSPEGVGANMVAGATGMIGSTLIDWLLLLNQEKQLNCKVIALGRNKQKARARFASYWEQAGFTFVEGDINQGINCEQDVDYVLQAASNTHPLAYSKFPISTITTNVIGTNNLLDYAAKHKAKRVIFLSSVEVYGKTGAIRTSSRKTTWAIWTATLCEQATRKASGPGRPCARHT